jgi:hypothetical protein
MSRPGVHQLPTVSIWDEEKKTYRENLKIVGAIV